MKSFKKFFLENIEEQLDENIGGLFKDASEWESSAKARGLVVKPATHPSGEATKYQIAKDKEGNNRGHFDHGIKSGKLKEEVELEEKLAWSHKTYADYVAHNKAKGLQVIPKDLWHNLKKNPNQPSMKKEEVNLDEEHSTWMVHVHKPVNKLKQGKTVMVKARNQAEAIHKGAIKHGDESARHGDFLRAEKLKEEVNLDEELEFTKRVHGSGPDVHDIFHKGKFVGSIGKHFPRNGRPEGYHVLQYTSGREPKGSRGITRHERINSHDDAKKLVAKHFNIQEETELDEVKKPKPGHNAAVMAKNISKVLAAIKK